MNIIEFNSFEEIKDTFNKPYSFNFPEKNKEDVYYKDKSVLIFCMAQLNHQGNVFEFGTFEGNTTRIFSQTMLLRSKIFTLDVCREILSKNKKEINPIQTKETLKKPEIGRIYKEKNCKNIIQLWGDSKVFDFSKIKEDISLAFIDGNHSYEYVLSDSNNALKLIKNKGFIIWHDFNNLESVNKALSKFLKEKSLTGYHLKNSGSLFSYINKSNQSPKSF